MASASVASVFVAVLAGAPVVRADEPAAPVKETPVPVKETPSADYQDGSKLFQLHDYAGALIKFRTAYELSKDPLALWYETVCARNLADYASYIRLMQEVQGLDPAVFKNKAEDVSDEALAKIPGSLATAMRFVGPLHLRSEQAGAEVFVDGTLVGKTPLPRPPVLLNLGERKIRVVKAGFKDFEQVVQVKGGGEVAVTVKLERVVRQGRLSVDAGVDGLISIDGKVVGRGRWEGLIASGGHTLKVSAPGKVTKEQEVAVVEDRRREIQVTLAEEPKQEWKKWAWRIAGGVLLAGTVVGGAVTARNSGLLVEGTINQSSKNQPSGNSP